MEAVIEMSVLVFNNMLVLAIVLIRSTLFQQKVLVITPTKLNQIKRQRSENVLKVGRNLLIFIYITTEFRLIGVISGIDYTTENDYIQKNPYWQNKVMGELLLKLDVWFGQLALFLNGQSCPTA